ncbi:MAG TPA: transposase [Candidatus Tectomicrobia bacterium]
MGAFRVRFWRPKGREALERSTTGLLTERPNKHGDTIAQAVPGTSAQRLPEFLTNMQWEAEDLNRQRVAKMSAEATPGDGVLVFDDTGFPKQGTTSVGVARPSSGTLGKVGHGQIAVTCCDSHPQATWPVAVRLYLPKAWAQDPARRQQARVPAEVAFQTKPEVALALLDHARAWGYRIGVWWPMPTMETTRTFWRAWRPGRSAMSWRCGPISRSVWDVRRPPRCGGPTRCSSVCPAGSGGRVAGGGGRRGGGASSVSRSVAGA